VNALVDASLKNLARSYADLLASSSAPSIADVCFSAATYRTRLPMQAVVSGQDREELIAGLKALSEGQSSSAVILGRRRNGEMQQPVFVFSGMGSQWKGMGQYILRQTPEPISGTIQQIDSLFSELL